jgi:hypothetical protein
VTLAILWEEYIAGESGGYRYSRYVAPRFMLRHGRQAGDPAGSPGPRRT